VILIADENIDQTVINRLRNDGNEVLSVGELVFRQNLVNAGVVLMRLAGLPAKAKGELLSRTLVEHHEEIQEAFTVISPGALRIRRRD
jgi:hypothetical protein